jgi:hypothetical protein
MDGPRHITNVNAFGFGAAFPGQSYPAIYIAGVDDGTYGIYRSIDNAATWKKLADYPMNIPNLIGDIDGDKETFGMLYGAFSGAGYFNGRLK